MLAVDPIWQATDYNQPTAPQAHSGTAVHATATQMRVGLTAVLDEGWLAFDTIRLTSLSAPISARPEQYHKLAAQVSGQLNSAGDGRLFVQYSNGTIHNVWQNDDVFNGSSPYINRFISADLIVPDPTNPQSYIRYTYVNNRPLSFFDPTGHFEEDAIYDYLLNECGTYVYCADYFYGLWSQNSEWWAMLLKAQAGDVLFVTFHAGPNDGFIHFRFDGHGRDILSGITFADADGNYIPGSLNGVSLLDIFNGQSSINYHGSNPTFEWSGLFRPAEGGMPLLPYVRESNRTEAFFTSEQVTWDSRFKGITGSIVGGLIVAEFCGGYCGLVAGAFAGQGAGEAMWFGWDEYGRQLNDRYWNVGGYHLTFRFNPNEGYSLIYYSGLGNGVVPFWLR